MARKKKEKVQPEQPEVVPVQRRISRTQLVLSVVATDNTFEPIFHARAETFDPSVSLIRNVNGEIGYRGRCIHCNSKLYVSLKGETDATVEHIEPKCNDGSVTDPTNLALACARCNNEKGIRHDRHAGEGGRADEVIAQLRTVRAKRWREPRAV